ncbi:MAG: tetratricopeptide repeat protein [Methylobacter sp.]
MLLNRNVLRILLSIAIITSGCVYNPPAVDSNRAMRQFETAAKKMPVRVGLYLSDDLKQYVYRRHKPGSDFQMKIGEHLPRIAMTMASTLFGDVTPVDRLPPYDENYRPDVEAVIRPEILFCYGNTVGAFEADAEAKIKLRVAVYDLGGNALWQDEAIGGGKSADMDFAAGYSGTDIADQAGYQAIFAAATHVIDDFYAKPPQDLLTLTETKKTENPSKLGTSPDFELFKTLYARGQSQYKHKNYHQSSYLFEKALLLAPGEPAALFYTGASYTHTGDRQRALDKFTDVIRKASGPESQDSRKWIQRLNDPLKVGVVGRDKAGSQALNHEIIQNALLNNGMYKIIDSAKLTPESRSAASDFARFIDKSSRRGAQIVILHDIDSISKRAESNHYSGEDVATEHNVRISAKVYSAKKKHLKTEVWIDESASTIQEQSPEEALKIQQQLLQSGAKKLVLELLKNDIF